MTIKFSKRLNEAIAKGAAGLSPERPKIRLSGIYNGFLVYLEKPNRDGNRTIEYTYEKVGIDKEGIFWLYVEELGGFRTPPADN